MTDKTVETADKATVVEAKPKANARPKVATPPAKAKGKAKGEKRVEDPEAKAKAKAKADAKEAAKVAREAKAAEKALAKATAKKERETAKAEKTAAKAVEDALFTSGPRLRLLRNRDKADYPSSQMKRGETPSEKDLLICLIGKEMAEDVANDLYRIWGDIATMAVQPLAQLAKIPNVGPQVAVRLKAGLLLAVSAIEAAAPKAKAVKAEAKA